jgi:hypothetical protein
LGPFCLFNSTNELTAPEAQKLVKYQHLLKQHEKDLVATEEEPYKEVKLEDGTVLFSSISVAHLVSASKTYAAPTTVQAGNSMTSSQGAKNAFGYVLYKLDYTTSWSYDYDKVTSSSSYVSVDNGVGWSYKGSSSNGPTSYDNGREHEWVGTAQFAIVVGGIDVSNETLINKHRVRYDGTDAWKYENS